MRPKTMVMLLVAIGCGVLAAVGSTFLGARPQEDKIKVFTAAADVPVNTPLKETKDIDKHFVVKEVPKDLVLKGAITDKKRLENKVVGRELAKGEQVTDQHIGDTKGPPLKEGERAYTIGVNAERAVAGFILPAARVDIIAVSKRTKRNSARVILENMEVLAVNTNLDGPEKGKNTIVPVNVTLRCPTLEHSLRLAQFKDISTLSLALRPKDAKPVDERILPDLPNDEEVEVLVATADLEPGTVLENPELYLKKDVMEAKDVPPGALHDFAIAKGKTLKNVVTRDKAITFKDFALAKKEEKPVEVPEVVEKPRHFVMRIQNGSAKQDVLHPEKPADARELLPVPPPNGGSDGKN